MKNNRENIRAVFEKVRRQNVAFQGIPIKNVLTVGAGLGIVLLCVVFFCLSIIAQKYRELVNNVDVFADGQKYITQLQDASDYMTEQCRLFIITQKPEHMYNYFTVVNGEQREKALEALEGLLKDKQADFSLQELSAALNESNSLMEYEIHAMKLICSLKKYNDSMIPNLVRQYQLTADEEGLSNYDKLEKAYHNVFGAEYRTDKVRIDRDIQGAVYNLLEELRFEALNSTNRLRLAIIHMLEAASLMFVLLIIIIIMVQQLVIRPLNSCVKHIEDNSKFDNKGSREFRYLAQTYNNIFDINMENKKNMKFQIEHDALTQVYSRQAFEDQKRILSKATQPMAMMMIDVDFFKSVNDNFGHEEGDMALVRIADTLRHYFRAEDVIARVGGDEFVVLLMNVTEEDKRMIGKKIDKINAALQNPNNGEIKTSLSVGVAFSDKGYRDEMYRQADEALYKVKANGKCGYCIYMEE